MDNLDREFERLKLAVDAVKHITTLATGTIALVVTFSDKLPRPLPASVLLASALSLMVICLHSSFIYLWKVSLGENIPKIREGTVFLSNVIYFSFSCGIALLVIFAAKSISK
jgi:hypothetical protein